MLSHTALVLAVLGVIGMFFASFLITVEVITGRNEKLIRDSWH